jgi:hypothetical protein
VAARASANPYLLRAVGEPAQRKPTTITSCVLRKRFPAAKGGLELMRWTLSVDAFLLAAD